jgi:hypothetical protein
MAPLRELLSWQWIQSESILSDPERSLFDGSRTEVSTFELEHQNLIEEMVWHEIAVVELLDLEGNMIDH